MPQIKNGPKELNDILESAYKSALAQYGDKSRASAVAWSVAKERYKKRGGRWVSKLYVDTGKLVLAKRALLRSSGGTVKMVECMRIPSEELVKFMKGDSPDTDIEMLTMSEVLVNPYNREVDRAKVDAIKESVKGSGAVKPVVYSEVDRDGAPAKMITDGHHRYVALKEMGYAEIPARMSDEDGLDTTADDEPVKLQKEIVTSDVVGLELTRQDLGVRHGPKPYRKLPGAKMSKADLKAGKIDMATFTQRTQPLYNLQARLRDKAESMGEKVGSIRVPFGKYHSAEIVDFDKPFESGVEVQEFLRSNDVVMCSVDENTSSLDKNELRRLVFEQYLDDNNMLYKKGFGPQGQASYMIKVCGKNEVDAVRVHLNKKYNQPGLISVIGGMISFYYSNSVEYRGSLSKMCAGTGLTDNYYCFDGQKFRI